MAEERVVVVVVAFSAGFVWRERPGAREGVCWRQGWLLVTGEESREGVGEVVAEECLEDLGAACGMEACEGGVGEGGSMSSAEGCCVAPSPTAGDLSMNEWVGEEASQGLTGWSKDRGGGVKTRST